MKMEIIPQRHLIAYYIKQNYGDRTVLVICQDYLESTDRAEYEQLLYELSEIRLLPPRSYQNYNFLIIEMLEHDARKIIKRHHHVQMLLFVDGRVVDETQP